MIVSSVFIRALALTLSILGTSSAECLPCNEDNPRLLIVSYDGFRPDLLERGYTPYMNKFREEGVYASDVTNAFPTVTYVNHQTIATGLYPETHGIVYNYCYDPLEGNVTYGYDLYHYNNSVEPIWTLNEKCGKHSACVMWPGCEFEYGGVNQTYAWPLNTSVPFQDRVDLAIACLTDKDKPANLVFLYYEFPDALEEAFGPDSIIVNQTLAQIDNFTYYIQQQLIAHNLDKCVNVIHLSDHGITSTTPQQFFNITPYMRDGTYTFYGYSPIIQIWPTNEMWLEELYVNLTKASKELGHFDVYKKQDLPPRWHLANNRRSSPIWVVPELGYAFQDMIEFWQYYFINTFNAPPISNSTVYGIHGYDNCYKEMHPLFMAKGPLFAKGKTLPPFHFVDLYNLFCKILNLKSVPNEGSSQMEMWDNLFAAKASTKNEDNDNHEVCRKCYISETFEINSDDDDDDDLPSRRAIRRTGRKSSRRSRRVKCKRCRKMKKRRSKNQKNRTQRNNNRTKKRSRKSVNRY